MRDLVNEPAHRTSGLFTTARRAATGLDAVPPLALLPAPAGAPPVSPPLDPAPDERLMDIYRRVRNPDNPQELLELYLGRVEAELGPLGHRQAGAERWRSSTVRREVSPHDVLNSRATVRFVKELFNSYFRDDLYGDLRDSAEVILSGGAVDEESWGLPAVLKESISYALYRDWYGYSDSRGRDAARQAVADYESARLGRAVYGRQNVAITMGATFAISSVIDMIRLTGTSTGGPALCAIPNYPPLVESAARRGSVQLVPLTSHDGVSSLRPLIEALRPDTPFVLLQTAANPTGAIVPEAELVELIRAASPATMILLDECHEWLGVREPLSPERARANVIRFSSLSKNWSAPGLKVGWFVADQSFIDEYYEYASTTFGGPPSFFYTLIEVLARMEAWLISGVDRIGPGHQAEFEAAYGFQLAPLQQAYDNYRADRLDREATLTTLRDAVTARLRVPAFTVTPAASSINLSLAVQGHDDSYVAFRDLLRRTGVSVFPGILTFCLSGGNVRVTTSRRWSELEPALRRLAGYSRTAP
ncbi:pyridoxal phosphate-dependent aminotransferase [Winogradskya humida]|uniref:Aminotransferase class I/classII large domain-containing protein n=1 Tax=Winogradskya humida TaxID=113566 RepID=A0ABQ4A110_9ACTN|nr:pyridoxal phosphate-dependent aminotransferase [Actinoplanes humidus]GIE24545.1 hypothetical protein Ahu01nite_076470 [Actinoplanes humidus]